MEALLFEPRKLSHFLQDLLLVQGLQAWHVLDVTDALRVVDEVAHVHDMDALFAQLDLGAFFLDVSFVIHCLLETLYYFLGR